jgi:hypothetical protein
MPSTAVTIAAPGKNPHPPRDLLVVDGRPTGRVLVTGMPGVQGRDSGP